MLQLAVAPRPDNILKAVVDLVIRPAAQHLLDRTR
jgi:hypothetical protein